MPERLDSVRHPGRILRVMPSTADAPARRPVLARASVVVLIVLGYVAILHYAYVLHIAPLFTYLQYGYRTPDPYFYAVAIGLVVVNALALPRHITRPSHVIAWILFIIAVIPSLVVPQYAPALSKPVAFELALWVGGCFLLVATFGTRQALRGFIPLTPLRPQTWWLIVAIAFVVLNGIVVAAIGVTFNLPALDDVYGVRGEFRIEQAADPALGYVVALLDKLINPLMIIRGLRDRRWTWAAAGVLASVYLYAEQGNKSALFTPVAMVGAYLLLRRYRPTGTSLLLAAPLASMAVMAVDWALASNDMTSLIIRRVLVTPGLVLAGYVQTFYDMPKAHLAYSVLSPFLHYTYDKEPPDLVGAQFFDHPATHANGSWLADGYANFGYPGMLLATAVLILLLWAVDDATRGLPAGFACLIFVMPGLALAESAILTALLTHGFIAAIILSALAPRDGPEADSDRTGDIAAPSDTRLTV